MALTQFETNVFVNCPFDARYQPLLRAMLFTIVACGFTPRVALEDGDAGANRQDKIRRLILESRLGIHDISRTDSDARSGLPRFNMPFELGLDIGARYFGTGKLKYKKLLVLDKERYRYQQFLSDIAGQDIAAHADTRDVLIENVRDWLNGHRDGGPPLMGAAGITESIDDFSAALPAMCHKNRLEPEKLNFQDFLFYTTEWIGLTA
jgi:hypothetical protein